jgi:hypothetical protein
MKNALKGTYEAGARQSPPPREFVANAISRIVRNSLKGQPDTVVEAAILQARREADSLYILVIEVNSVVQESIAQREREGLFLVGYLNALRCTPTKPVLVEQLRNLTLLLVEEVLLLDRAISQVSAERFDGRAILFSDSAIKLRALLDMAHEALENFNFWARLLKCAELTSEEICDKLSPEIHKQVARWMLVARGQTLAAFGGEHEFRASLDQLVQLCKGRPIDFTEHQAQVRPT